MTVEFKHFLAKSSQNPCEPKEGEKLLCHTKKVVESFQILFGHDKKDPTQLGLEWLRFFKLSQEEFPVFFVTGIVSCFLHDSGKANSAFQSMLRGKKTLQVLYHEQISGFLILLPSIREWLKTIPLFDEKSAFGAIVSHHLRCSESDFLQPQNPDIKIFKVFSEPIKEILDHCSIFFQIEKLPEPFELPPVWDLESPEGFNLQKNWEPKLKREMARFSRELKKTPQTNRLLMAIRASLIVADSSASGLFREGKNLQDWLKTAFNGTLSGKYIQKNVIQPRIDHIQNEKGWFQWNDFQLAMDKVPSRALLLAPCGSGKTLAAWRWIKSQLEKKPVGRVLFLYPTRATATEGFRDYISWAPESDVALIHGTSSYDLEGMFENAADDRSRKSFSIESRLFSLGCWHRKIFSATVDQFLGFMQQAYESICLFPLLSECVVVFDEIHSFDRSLFSAFKLFLKNFDVPALCMTASLPTNRREELVAECGLSLFPGETQAFEGLDSKAHFPRYQIEFIEDVEQVETMVSRKWHSGEAKKILWVVNTVARCQQIFSKFKENKPVCYHSRYKLEDRKKKHQEVIETFQDKERKIFAVTTQVCEMSLDLDADLLVSETAPITSLIQRMGRCNRHLQESGRVGAVFLYPPENEMPYDSAELESLSGFLKEISGKTVSQENLNRLLEEYGQKNVEIEKYSAFLENGLWAVGREESLRDATNFTVQAILESDIPRFFELRNQKKPVDGLILPVPSRFARKHPRLGSFPMIAPTSHYHPDSGFWDSPLPEIIGGMNETCP